MRSSLRDLQLMEAYLEGRLPPSEREAFRQRLLLEPDLYAHLHRQKRFYQLIRESGRRRLRRELDQLHQELFSRREHLSWRKKILDYFGL